LLYRWAMSDYVRLALQPTALLFLWMAWLEGLPVVPESIQVAAWGLLMLLSARAVSRPSPTSTGCTARPVPAAPEIPPYGEPVPNP